MSDWTSRFLSLAKEVSSWSKDPSTQVGAVIVRQDKTVASLGYNGFPRFVCDKSELYEDRELKYKRIVHAEANAIVTAREPLHGHTIYTWPFMPCPTCTGLVLQSGIQRVVSPRSNNPRWRDSFAVSEQMFREADVTLTFVG